jgi:polar amino acid transport system permease protein
MWSWEFALKILPELFSALWVTILATFTAFFLAAIVGLFLAMARRSKMKWLSWTTGGFIEFIRSTPLLVQLFFVFYVFPEFGLSLSPFTAGVLALGLHYSTYLSEVYRSGIDSIPQGQWEAGKALNFSKARTWTGIIIPQAIPPVVPMMGNYLIAMFKETPLLSTITLVEMMLTAKIIGSQSFRYLEAFTLVGLMFLALSYTAAVLVRRLEDKLNRQFHLVKR